MNPGGVQTWRDGLVDAGVLSDDSDKFLVGPDLRRDYGPHEVRVDVISLARRGAADTEPRR